MVQCARTVRVVAVVDKAAVDVDLCAGREVQRPIGRELDPNAQEPDIGHIRHHNQFWSRHPVACNKPAEPLHASNSRPTNRQMILKVYYSMCAVIHGATVRQCNILSQCVFIKRDVGAKK